MDDAQPDAQPDVTGILIAWSGGDRAALDRLLPLLYGELRRLAQSHLRRQKPGHTLQPTALVHEAFLKMAGQQRLAFESRAQFFGLAAHVMRQVLVDHARAEKAAKRGGGASAITLNEDIAGVKNTPRDVLALDAALESLAKIDPRKCEIVEMRFFGGLTSEEIAAASGISIATVGRELRLAQAWLHRSLSAA